MAQTILVATDGSDHARRAVIMAAALAGIYDAKLILLHVLPDVVNENIPGHLGKFVELERLDLGDVLNAIADSIIREATQMAQEQGAKDIESFVPSGSPSKEILKAADHYDADFIVMGRRGLGDLEGLLLGSVSHKVSHLAKQTCITVR
jgi:nucleotide-binding universal stress UspA family protein